MNSVSLQRLAAALLLTLFIGLLILQRPLIAPIFDSLLYGHLSQLFIQGFSAPISDAEMNLLITGPTTGPLFIPLFSLFHSLLDASLASINLSALLLNTTLLLVLGWRLTASLSASWLRVGALFAVLFSLWLQDTRWFLYALGDGPALLLGLIAATFALDNQLSLSKRHRYFTLVATLALLTRLTVLPMIAGAALYLIIVSWQQLPPAKRLKTLTLHCLINTGMFLSCYAVVVFLEYLCLHISSFALYSELMQIRRNYLAGNQTMQIVRGETLSENFMLIAESAAKNWQLLQEYFQSRFSIKLSDIACLIVALVTPLIYCNRKLRKHRLTPWLSLSLAMLLLQAIWFFSVPELLYTRYTYHLATVLFLAACFALLIVSPYLMMAAVILLSAVLITNKPSFLAEIPFTQAYQQEAQRSEQHRRSVLELKAFLDQQSLPTMSYFKLHGISFAVPLNYLLASDKQIVGVEALVSRNVQQTGQAANSDYLLVMDRFFWRTMKFKANNLAFQNRLHRACTSEVFGNLHYRVMRCDQQSLNREFPAEEVRSWQLPSYAW